MKSKVILLTGGSGLIGMNLISHYLNMGCKIITTVSKKKSEMSLKKKYENYIDDSLVVIKQDFREKNFEKKIFRKIKYLKIVPNVIINNARNLANLKLSSDGVIKEESWLLEFHLAVIAPYKLIKEFLRINKNPKFGRVISMGSIYGTDAIKKNLQKFNKDPVPMHYSVSKASLIHMTKEFAAMNGNSNITFNTISFGGVRGRESKQFRRKYSELTPSSRMVELDEILGAVDFLISSSSSGVNGHNLMVDGGWTIW